MRSPAHPQHRAAPRRVGPHRDGGVPLRAVAFGCAPAPSSVRRRGVRPTPPRAARACTCAAQTRGLASRGRSRRASPPAALSAGRASSKGITVHCPFCRHPDSRVVDSRTSDDGSTIRRRRQCPHCNRRFTTVETASLSVVKRSGATEPFSREKIVGGVRKACQGRPVSEDDLALLAQKVEETLRSAGSAEIDAYEIGLAILGPLRELDEVAYLRFASVYQAFDSLEDFEAAITVLRAERDGTGRRATSPTRPRAAGRGRAPTDLRRGADGDAGRRRVGGARRFVGCFLSDLDAPPCPRRPRGPPRRQPRHRLGRPARPRRATSTPASSGSVDLDGDAAAAAADPRPPRHRPRRVAGRPLGRVPARRAGRQAAGAPRRVHRRRAACG